ncbi:nucleotide exchange factor GrpE [Alkalicoccus chagannorensis]|uniref:nucleotide exchange factor GrpE n=1 Tax=Alkalicoccus chagannorensis TaxID=427072 RepID=UPI00041E3024|nr:nucleotide exchange factor GrpE [Alkalicoccus chagannorensis]
MSEDKKEQVQEEEVHEAAQEHAEEADAAAEEEEVVQEDTAESRLETENAELKDRLARVQADYDNFRRRTKHEKESAAKYKSQTLAEGLLPALDNFERALMMEPETEEAKNLLQGMQMVYNQLNEALEAEGIHVMPAVGEAFDPHRHEAVMQVETDEYESNVVTEELQKGYVLKDKVIRPAMVKVNA